MLLKLGVDISRLTDEIRQALPIIESACNAAGAPEPVITSTYEGMHSPGSLHYANRAIDVRMLPNSVIDSIKQRLGKHYDVVREADHVHVEWDPKV